MPESVTLKESTTLNHQSNLGEDVDEIPFDAGTELTVLKEWGNHYLVKDDDGKLFTLRKELAEG